MNCSVFGCAVLVRGGGLSSFDVVGYVFDEDWRDVCLSEFVDECVEVDCVEGFGHVECYEKCSFGGFLLVEACGDVVVDVM